MNNPATAVTDGPPAWQAEGIRHLIAGEPDFARIIKFFGPPPPWRRHEGFSTLIRIILEQQVSLASARAAFERLAAAAGTVTPERLLRFDDRELKTIGFSRQKTAYGRYLAEAILSGVLDLRQLTELDDDTVRAALTAIKGIGNWTADIYLLMAMQRPDIWPRGDIALAAGYRSLKDLPTRPTSKEMEEISRSWRPYRSLAARLLWHLYLSCPASAPVKMAD